MPGRLQGCLVGNINGAGSDFTLFPKLKRSEMNDFRGFWLKMCDNFGFLAVFHNNDWRWMCLKAGMMVVDTRDMYIASTHLEWPEMSDFGAFGR